MGRISVKQLGANNSAVDKMELSQGETTVLAFGSVLYILKDEYPHVVEISECESNSEITLEDKTKGNEDFPMQSFEEKGNGKRCSSLKRPADATTQASTKRQKKEITGENKTPGCTTSLGGKICDPRRKQCIKTKGNKKDDTGDAEEDLKCVQSKLDWLGKSGEEDEKRTAICIRGGICHSTLATQKSTWEIIDKMVIYTKAGIESRERIAAFDVDGTIVFTKTGKKFPLGPNDWRIAFPEIPKKIQKLHSNGYKIVFFTNQRRVETNHTRLEDVKKKISGIVDQLSTPIQVFVAIGGGIYRKPVLGMWNHLLEKANDNIPVDVTESFYVGDAAGRPEKWVGKRKKDFSCSDRLFSINAGLRFFTPEEYFLGEKPAPFNMPDFDPRLICLNANLFTPPSTRISLEKKQEVLLLVGYPASGKSFFATKYLVPKGYLHVNRDDLGRWQKCVEVTQQALRGGKSVVVDNTSPDLESRNRYLQCANKMGIICRCFWFNVSVNHARHNERFRQLVHKSKPVSDMVMHIFKSKFIKPTLKEGFTEVAEVNFVKKFEKEEHETLYKQFLLDKYL